MGSMKAGAALALAVMAVPAAHAGQFGPGYYQCTVNVATGSDSCTEGIVTVTEASGNQRVARIDVSAGYLRLDALVDVCSPAGWWIHFTDSPTGDGGGGDFEQTEHDAEAYVRDARFEMFGMYNATRGVLEPAVTSERAAPGSGCYQVQWTVFEDYVAFDDDGDTADPPQLEVGTLRGFDVWPYGEPDAEDPDGLDGYLWYVGVNRTVGNAFRSGSGVGKVCLVLSTTASPAPATISSACASGG